MNRNLFLSARMHDEIAEFGAILQFYDIMLRGCIFWLLALTFVTFSNSQNTSLPAGCYESNYTSSFTRCDLSFLFCYSRRVLQKCILRKCQRYIRAGECYYESGFVLQEATCYKTCCGSTIFDEQGCNQYNIDAKKREKAVQTNLTIILSIIAVILLVFVIWYSTKHMKCCDNREHFTIMKYNIKWHKDQYKDSKCDICRTFGPLMVTPCHHYFHISCFEETVKEITCPKCQEPIKDRIKIYCFHCRERSFKVKIYRVTDIAQAISEGKGLHYDLCPKEIRTHRRMADSQQQL